MAVSPFTGPAVTQLKPRIVVFGVGGAGVNAVNNMIESGLEGVDFVVANTDAQQLSLSLASQRIQLGVQVTQGLGAGANPNAGLSAAEESAEEIIRYLDGADMVFITAGMGGGTGTGGVPVVAQTAREMGILTVAVVTKPFSFEGRKRAMIAEEGIRQLSQYVDSLITIPNEKLLSVLGKSVTLLDAFKAANNVLLGAVQGIADLITRPGLINVDFADVRTVMSEMGMAMMGTGVGRGENRAREAAEAAIRSPLLEDINLQGARGILVNITAGPDLSLGEFEEVGDTIEEFASDSATVVVGTVIDPEMSGEIKVTVVATGLGETRKDRPVKVIDNTVGAGAGQPDYRGLDSPAVRRRQAGSREPMAERPQMAVGAERDLDYLDIPAFLRRQAD